jgi:hypothetical protein
MSHNTIPHTNVMLEEIGRITGAWEAEFNNDLDNLKYPKILTNRRGGSAPGADG